MEYVCSGLLNAALFRLIKTKAINVLLCEHIPHYLVQFYLYFIALYGAYQRLGISNALSTYDILPDFLCHVFISTGYVLRPLIPNVVWVFDDGVSVLLSVNVA